MGGRYSCWVSWIIPLGAPEAIGGRFYTDAVRKTAPRSLNGPAPAVSGLLEAPYLRSFTLVLPLSMVDNSDPSERGYADPA
jgi:hypothetical protein